MMTTGMKNEPYDSTKDAQEHKTNVQRVMNELLRDINKRIENHDNSKFESPEREGYDKYIPMLKEAKYGSAEYNKIRKDMMDDCLSHHYEVNRHHPEHFENGILEFTIVDLFEYFVDTYAASLKSDTPYAEGVKINADKHKLPKELVEIFKNTVDEYFPK